MPAPSTTTRTEFLPVSLGIDVATWNGVLVYRNTLRAKTTYTVNGVVHKTMGAAWMATQEPLPCTYIAGEYEVAS